MARPEATVKETESPKAPVVLEEHRAAAPQVVKVVPADVQIKTSLADTTKQVRATETMARPVAKVPPAVQAAHVGTQAKKGIPALTVAQEVTAAQVQAPRTPLRSLDCSTVATSANRVPPARSEERRVGKECRCGGARER